MSSSGRGGRGSGVENLGDGFECEDLVPEV